MPSGIGQGIGEKAGSGMVVGVGEGGLAPVLDFLEWIWI